MPHYEWDLIPYVSDLSCDFDVNQSDYSILPPNNIILSYGFFIRFDVKSKFKNVPRDVSSLPYDSEENDTYLKRYSCHCDISRDYLLRHFLDRKYIRSDICDRFIQHIETRALSIANNNAVGASSSSLLFLHVDVSIFACREEVDDDDDDDVTVLHSDDEFDEDDYAHDEAILALEEDDAMEFNDDDDTDDHEFDEQVKRFRLDDILDQDDGMEVKRYGQDDIHPTCAVCLEDFSEGDYVLSMSCKHIYHGVCIQTWLNKSNVCPLCRSKML